MVHIFICQTIWSWDVMTSLTIMAPAVWPPCYAGCSGYRTGSRSDVTSFNGIETEASEKVISWVYSHLSCHLRFTAAVLWSSSPSAFWSNSFVELIHCILWGLVQLGQVSAHLECVLIHYWDIKVRVSGSNKLARISVVQGKIAEPRWKGSEGFFEMWWSIQFLQYQSVQHDRANFTLTAGPNTSICFRITVG